MVLVKERKERKETGGQTEGRLVVELTHKKEAEGQRDTRMANLIDSRMEIKLSYEDIKEVDGRDREYSDNGVDGEIVYKEMVVVMKYLPR